MTSITTATGAKYALTDVASAVAIAKATVAMGTVVREGYAITDLIAFPVDVTRNVLCISTSARKTGSAARECVNVVPGTRDSRFVR